MFNKKNYTVLSFIQLNTPFYVLCKLTQSFVNNKYNERIEDKVDEYM